MLILQHVWRRWTKATRAAADAQARQAMPEAFPLPPPTGAIAAGEAWIHGVRALEREAFAIRQQAGMRTHDAWAREMPMHPANLRWRMGRQQAECELSPPWPRMLRTAWPAQLPGPLCVVRPGEVVRIDWNGRFLGSLFGSDRSYFYDWHTYWLTWAEAPAREVLTATPPRKHIDLRTQIY